MDRNKLKTKRRGRRKAGIRKQVVGVPQRPRLTVFRSARHIYAQVVDDLAGRTLFSASTVEKGESVDNGGSCKAAAVVGKRIAERARAAGVQRVVFDRNGFKYHGRVKALAVGAREGGLQF
ncbi:MAG: 50S ribosomal protein L18 [Phycisphaerales bacterium]|nr:MAG: 50S ribosomal protein L18 [Phycisphaerales bacterium]